MHIFDRLKEWSRSAVPPVVALVAMSLAGVANAGWVVSGYSGFDSDNSAPGPATHHATTNYGIVSFGVYQNQTANWETALGVAPAVVGLPLSPAVDARADYVYFYEIANPSLFSVQQALTALQVSFNGTITSFGYLNHTVFQDSSGAVGPSGPAGNLFLGAGTKVTVNPSSGNGFTGTTDAGNNAFDVGFNGVPTLQNPVGFTPLFTADATAVAPANSSGLIGTSPDSQGIGSVNFGFNAPGILKGAYSDVLFFTSSSPYQYLTSAETGGLTSYNELPGAFGSPLPGSLVLLATGLASFGGFGWMKRRKEKSSAP